MVVMSTFDPRRHGDTADNDLLGQQHTNTETTDTVTQKTVTSNTDVTQRTENSETPTLTKLTEPTLGKVL